VRRGAGEPHAGSPHRRQAYAVLGRSAALCGLIVGGYYLVPVQTGGSAWQLALRIGGTVLVGALITWLIVRQVSGLLADPVRGSLAGLLTAVVGGVAFLALVDYLTARAGDQFVGLETRTDALYFALSTLTTVGYGDVHPTGQAARAVVAVQLVFNVVVIATGASVLTRVIGARVRLHHGTADDDRAER
jgi:voltage-gated potassium channel